MAWWILFFPQGSSISIPPKLSVYETIKHRTNRIPIQRLGNLLWLNADMTFILYQGRGLDPTNTWGGHNTKPQLYHLNIHLEPCSRFTLLLQQFACHLPSRLRPFRLRDLGFDLSLPPNIILLTPFEARARTLDGGLDAALPTTFLAWTIGQPNHMVDNGWVGKFWLGLGGDCSCTL